MKTHIFSEYHPIVSFVYFAAVITFSLYFMHPVCLAISFSCSILFHLTLSKKRTVKLLFALVPMTLLTALLNPLFNHEGATILTYLPSGNPLTLESVFYGLAAGIMIASLFFWFSCVNTVVTSDRLIYLFGRALPSLSLLLSMALRFVPRFTAQFSAISDAQKGIGKDPSSGGLRSRIRGGSQVLSILITWSLENAAQISDSMKSRGYGLPCRTAFTPYRLCRRDAAALSVILLLFLIILLSAIRGALYFRYFPSIRWAAVSPAAVCACSAYCLLFLFPTLLSRMEAHKWKRLRSGI